MNQILAELMVEASRQDMNHPAGYPFTRDGIRLGIASAEDEINEVWNAWNEYKRQIADGTISPGQTEHMRQELLQVMAVCYRIVRSIDNGPEASTEGNMPDMLG